MTIVDFPVQGSIGASRKPKRFDIEIYQGDTFEVTLVFKDSLGVEIDLTGVTFVTKFVGIDAAPDPVTQPDADAPVPINGEVLISIVDTSTLSGEYHWDLQLVSGGKKRTYIGGIVTVTTDITP